MEIFKYYVFKKDLRNSDAIPVYRNDVKKEAAKALERSRVENKSTEEILKVYNVQHGDFLGVSSAPKRPRVDRDQKVLDWLAIELDYWYDDDCYYVLSNVLNCSKHTSVLQALRQSLDCYTNQRACEIIRLLFKYDTDLKNVSSLSQIQLLDAALEAVCTL